MTERRLPAVVLGGLNAGIDGEIHDPLIHPELYEGVAIRRIAAFCLDLILIGILVVIAFVVTLVLSVASFFVLAFTMAVVSFVLFAVVYDVLTIGGRSAATPGMRVFGLRVMTWSGGRPDNFQALLMSALFWTIYPMTGWLLAAVALFNPRWRCAHDFLAGTVVVRANPVRAGLPA